MLVPLSNICVTISGSAITLSRLCRQVLSSLIVAVAASHSTLMDTEMSSKPIDSSVDELKVQIEAALNNVEEIKSKNAVVSFRSHESDDKEDRSIDKNDEIVLYVSIKIKKDESDNEDVPVEENKTKESIDEVGNQSFESELILNNEETENVDVKIHDHQQILIDEVEFCELEKDDTKEIDQIQNIHLNDDESDNNSKSKSDMDQCQLLTEYTSNKEDEIAIEHNKEETNTKEPIDSDAPKGVHWFKDAWKENYPVTSSEQPDKESTEILGNKLCEEGENINTIIPEPKDENDVKVDLPDKTNSKKKQLKDLKSSSTKKVAQVKKKISHFLSTSKDGKGKELQKKDNIKSQKPKGAHGLKLTLSEDREPSHPVPQQNLSSENQNLVLKDESNLKTEKVKVTGKAIRPKRKQKLSAKSKTAPSTPLKSPLGCFGQENQSESREPGITTSHSMETLPADFVTPTHSRIRRLRSKHSQSLDRVWMPGRRESFNSRVSKRFVKNENVGASSSHYYYAGQSMQDLYQCQHGQGKV